MMMTQEQCDELAALMRPGIAKLIEESIEDTTISITCSSMPEADPNGPSVMRFEIRVRGEVLSSEREHRVAKFFQDVGLVGVMTK